MISYTRLRFLGQLCCQNQAYKELENRERTTAEIVYTPSFFATHMRDFKNIYKHIYMELFSYITAAFPSSTNCKSSAS